MLGRSHRDGGVELRITLDRLDCTPAVWLGTARSVFRLVVAQNESLKTTMIPSNLPFLNHRAPPTGTSPPQQGINTAAATLATTRRTALLRWNNRGSAANVAAITLLYSRRGAHIAQPEMYSQRGVEYIPQPELDVSRNNIRADIAQAPAVIRSGNTIVPRTLTNV